MRLKVASTSSDLFFSFTKMPVGRGAGICSVALLEAVSAFLLVFHFWSQDRFHCSRQEEGKKGRARN